MSVVIPHFDRAAIVRAKDAEVRGACNVKITLLADSSATGGALSTVRIALENGADGARPHRHEKSAEMFYILDGRVQVLSGEDVVAAGTAHVDRSGRRAPKTLHDIKGLYDNYFLNSPELDGARK